MVQIDNEKIRKIQEYLNKYQVDGFRNEAKEIAGKLKKEGGYNSLCFAVIGLYLLDDHMDGAMKQVELSQGMTDLIEKGNALIEELRNEVKKQKK